MLVKKTSLHTEILKLRILKMYDFEKERKRFFNSFANPATAMLIGIINKMEIIKKIERDLWGSFTFSSSELYHWKRLFAKLPKVVVYSELSLSFSKSFTFHQHSLFNYIYKNFNPFFLRVEISYFFSVSVSRWQKGYDIPIKSILIKKFRHNGEESESRNIKQVGFSPQQLLHICLCDFVRDQV